MFGAQLPVRSHRFGRLLPLVAGGTGADVMKRIAAPMVGGLITSFLLELTVYPAVFAIWKKKHGVDASVRATDLEQDDMDTRSDT